MEREPLLYRRPPIVRSGCRGGGFDDGLLFVLGVGFGGLGGCGGFLGLSTG